MFATVIRSESLSTSRCLQRELFPSDSVIFSLYTRRGYLRDNFGLSFIIVIRLQNDCKCCTLFVKAM